MYFVLLIVLLLLLRGFFELNYKMEQHKKKRGENWSSEEKEILRQLIAQSAHIIEDKSTKTSINMQKVKEWNSIQIRFNEIVGKRRSDLELKLAWKRMKLSAKSNLSSHRREQTKTGGGEKPPSPSPEDLEIMAIAPHDFVIEFNDYDCDALNPVPIPTTAKSGPSFKETEQCEAIHEENPEQHVVDLMDLPDTESTRMMSIKNNETVNTSNTTKKRKRSLQNRTEEMRQSIVESNTDFKRKQLEFMEEEHKYNIKIAKLKIKKIELEIALLESKKHTNNEE